MVLVLQGCLRLLARTRPLFRAHVNRARGRIIAYIHRPQPVDCCSPANIFVLTSTWTHVLLLHYYYVLLGPSGKRGMLLRVLSLSAACAALRHGPRRAPAARSSQKVRPGFHSLGAIVQRHTTHAGAPRLIVQTSTRPQEPGRRSGSLDVDVDGPRPTGHFFHPCLVSASVATANCTLWNSVLHP